jgi:hypothetical protein
MKSWFPLIDDLTLDLHGTNTNSPNASMGLISDVDADFNTQKDLVDRKDFLLLNGTSVVNNSFVFDGTDDYIDFQSNTNLLFLGTSSYTLSVWVNVTSTTNGLFHGIINREYGNPRNGYNMWFYQNPETIAIASERWTGPSQQVAFVLLPTNQCIDTWNQFTVTFDGTDLKFYSNGVFSNGMEATGNITNTTGTLQVGRRQADYGNCKISNVKMYDKSLTQSEVTQNYESQKSRYIN